jgi:hypothetical protein
VLEDDELLLSLTFRLGVAAPRCSSSHALRRGRASQHPRLLERVSSAFVCMCCVTTSTCVMAAVERDMVTAGGAHLQLHVQLPVPDLT